jgi:hypothetical protein
MSTTKEKNMNKHTPGPWFVTGEGLSRYVEAKINGALIQEVAWCGATMKDEQEDNARLIAAAPELLEKCEKIVDWLDRLAAKAEMEAKDTRFASLSAACAADAQNYRKTAADIRIVIAKATGE